MEKKSKAPMIYGYAVCLVAVITFIICIAGLVNAVMNLSDPLHAERSFNKSPSLASFEIYKMDILTSSEKEQSFTPDDQTLLAMYEAAKSDKIQSVKHRAMRNIMVNSLLIVICVALFLTHWLWMRRLNKTN
jgi:hypothetical protein